MEEETNLKDEIKTLNENFNKLLASGKIKGFKVPKSPSGSQVKKGFIHVFYVRENGNIEPMKVQVEEGTTSIEGAPRLATADYMLSYKGKPALIIDSLSSEPYNQKKIIEGAIRDKMLAAGYRLLANRVELGQIKAKKKMNGVLIFAIIIGVIIAGYLLLK